MTSQVFSVQISPVSTLGPFTEAQELGTAAGTEKPNPDPHSVLRKGEEELAVKAGAWF